ncbi:MAG: hypothetical protein K2M53_03415 [Muribaculaceae bacterium]|nr:hypothetical protein [Muribaculaceae bacterium]
MKKPFLFALALAAGLPLFAASPFEGSAPAEGKYYLYQVESDQWLEPNMCELDEWNTHAALGKIGMEIELKKIEGFEGYQIFCNFTNNGELNGSDEDRFFLDQGNRELSDWIFTPSGDGYTIMIKARPRYNDDETPNMRSHIENDTFIGYNAEAMFGGLSDNPEGKIWQLVSREERLKKMQADAKANGSVDATWLIPWNDRSNNNMRDRLYSYSDENNGSGIVRNGGGLKGYPVAEYWHQALMSESITLTDLPKGTYAFSVQGYYRDTEIESEELAQRMLEGTEVLDRCQYYAGADSKNFMSIYADAAPEQSEGFSYEIAGKWVPNSLDDASRAMFAGHYINDWAVAPVADGNLTIGVKKTAADHRDWLVFKKYMLEYRGEKLVDEDLTGLQAQLQALIDEAAKLPQTPTFVVSIEEAKDALANEDATSASLLAAIESFERDVKEIKRAENDIKAFWATQDFIKDEKATEQFNVAKTAGEYGDAIRTLRYARRIQAAVTENHEFKGAKPEEGKSYYLYNVGRKQFLTGGSDWGAHAALGMPGTEITLDELVGPSKGMNEGFDSFVIRTGLNNPSDDQPIHDYLSYRGYMDGDWNNSQGGWAFVPVEGKENVFNMVQGDYSDVYVMWNPYGSTDAGNNDEQNVCTESHDVDPEDLNAQWMLVTREERDALIEKASLENPVDLSYYIQNPGFNQRADVSNWETGETCSIWERGNNHYDFAIESYNTDNCALNQNVEGLPGGVYVAYVQGFYRNGNHGDQANLEPLQNAFFYAGNDSADDVALPNILAEANNAPGEGNNAVADNEEQTVYNIPDGIVQATHFFKSGLYTVYTVINHEDGNDLPLGIYKDEKGEEGDWVVADNFRVVYYGADTTVDAVKDALENQNGVEEIVTTPAANQFDGRIFNLQGVQVKDATVPGIYIQNGKKFIVK